ncbi:restriction endonuclease subunit S [Phormidium tenue FACHB-886]|nr:restriction endonuclease subunit S [Phormidium tenue FACHB-886]
MSQTHTKLKIVLPIGWKLKSLNEVAEVIDCKHRTPVYTNEGYPVVRPRDVRETGICFDQCLQTSYEEYKDLTEKRQPQIGDIVYSRNATFGVASLVNKQTLFAIGQDVCLIVPKSIDSGYLCRLLNAPFVKQQLDLVVSGSTFKRINLSEIRKLQILLPPLEEQRRIAAILDRADAVRRKRQEAIALTEELFRSAFLEMFGDPVTNPKGWETVTVGDIISDVRDGPHVSPEYSEAGIPIISTRNIRPGRLILEDVKYISGQTYTKLVKYFKPQRGDVLLTKGGTTGFAKVVDWDWSFAIWVHIAALRPTERIRAEFLESALNSPSCYAQSQRYTHGIANRDLGLTRIRKIQLSLPPLPLQDQFCNFRQALLKKLATQEQSLNESNELFNSLLQRAFRGEL